MPSRRNHDRNHSRRAQLRAAHVAATPLSVGRVALYILAGALLSLGLIKPSAAQSSSSSTSEGPGHAFTLNPFFLLAGWVSGEYEQRVNSTFTLGGGVSYVDFSDRQYTDFDLKARIYPNEKAMRGFEMGLGLGVTTVNTDTDNNDCDGKPCGSSKKTKVTKPAVSLEFGHQWNLGNNRRTILALGGGGKRFIASKSDLNGTRRVIPFVRIGIGYGW